MCVGVWGWGGGEVGGVHVGRVENVMWVADVGD